MPPIKRVSRKQFLDLATSKDAPGDLAIAKTFANEAQKVIDEASRIVEFTISTEAVDRDKDTIAVDGWKLENFSKGGSVLFGHQSFAPPIAKPVATFVEGSKLKGRAEFIDAETSEFADMIFRMVKGGFLRSSSVGFRALEFELSDDPERMGVWGPGIDFKSQELLEWSVVPVPANPEALVDAASMKGMNMPLLVDWTEQALDESDASPFADRKQIESLRTLLVPKWGKSAILRSDDDPESILDDPTDPDDDVPEDPDDLGAAADDDLPDDPDVDDPEADDDDPVDSDGPEQGDDLQAMLGQFVTLSGWILEQLDHASQPTIDRTADTVFSAVRSIVTLSKNYEPAPTGPMGFGDDDPDGPPTDRTPKSDSEFPFEGMSVEDFRELCSDMIQENLVRPLTGRLQ